MMFNERELIADRHSEQREFSGTGFPALEEGSNACEERLAFHSIEACERSAAFATAGRRRLLSFSPMAQRSQ